MSAAAPSRQGSGVGEGDQPSKVVAELTIWQRGAAAGVASLLSSLALNPMDVVKTRMQTQSAASIFGSGAKAASPPPDSIMALRYSPGTGLTSGLFHGGEHNGAMFTGNAPVVRMPPAARTPRFRSLFDGLYKIARHEGLQTLWRGTDAAVFMTVPLVAIYLPLYDHLLDSFSGAGAYAPLVAGGTARAVAGFVTAPLELARTRMQAQQQSAHSAAKRSGILQQLTGTPGTSSLRRITSLWTGMGASLAKDVPFAALYWSMLEPLRGWLMLHDYQRIGEALWQNANLNEVPVVGDVSEVEARPLRSRTAAEILAINIAAAGSAASLAAAVTTPFDVVKTKQQTAPAGKVSSIGACLVKVYKAGGLRGLFAGGGPRTARTAAGYAMVTSLFEVFKEGIRTGQD